MLVKICGITDPKTVNHLLTLHVDMVGLVFVKTSPRYVSIEQAIKLKKCIRDSLKTVAVFQNQSLDEVMQIVNRVRPDYVQLHGQEDLKFCEALSVPIIKTINLEKNARKTAELLRQYTDSCEYFLIDRKVQGKGPLVDLDQVSELSKHYPLILSGGLNSNNISGILETVGKTIVGVDISSGVEDSPGHKNINLITNFTEKVRSSL